MKPKDIETCWICQLRPATTREHMVLKARLDLIPFQNETLLVENLRSPLPARVHGPNSNAVKFGKTLCAECNNVLSQDWDAAYLQFIKHGISFPNYLRNMKSIRWSDEIPEMGKIGTSLARYYVKAIGCRLVDRGIEVPAQLKGFLLQEQNRPPFSLQLVEDYNWLDITETAAGRFDYPMIKFNYVKPSNIAEPPEVVIGLFHEGPYGVFFNFDSSSSNCEFFPNQSVSRIYSRESFSPEYQHLWATPNKYRKTVENFDQAGRLHELQKSPDFLNIFGTHGEI